MSHAQSQARFVVSISSGTSRRAQTQGVNLEVILSQMTGCEGLKFGIEIINRTWISCISEGISPDQMNEGSKLYMNS